MSQSWDIIGWAIITFVVVIILLLIFGIGRIFLEQALTDRHRNRAHAGKVTCEDEKEDCDKIAVRVTPNGYFCDTHWWENSRKATYSGSVSYGHILDHAMKGKV